MSTCRPLASRMIVPAGSPSSSTVCTDRTPLSRALIELSDRIRVPSLTRTVEQLTGALERGSPLAETLRARAGSGKLQIEVQDQCGGIPESESDPFAPFGERRGKDRTGLGLGLSIARNAVRAQGGDVTVRNIPGSGCIFTIEVPMVRPELVPVL